MSVKKSVFNFIYQRENQNMVVYNTFSKALVEFSEADYPRFQNVEQLHDAERQALIENGILVDADFDERAYLKYIHYKSKFCNDTLFLTIAPTLDCNFACPYCYENRRKGKMSPKIQQAILEFIDEKIESGVRTLDIFWYGGEPLLYFDIVENLASGIIQRAEAHNCILKMHMVTNGYLLTPHIVERLDELGITKIQITLDGLHEHHDVRRPLRNGKGSFDQIMQNLSLFADSPIAVVVRMNVDRKNREDFLPLREKIRALQNPNIDLYASPVEDLNKDNENTVSDFMSHQEFEDFAVSCADKGISNENFSIMDDRYCFCTSEIENCYVVDDCGDFYKCWDEVGRTEYRCFNISDPNSVQYSQIAHYVAGDPFSDPKCNACVFLPLCFGGCKFQRAHLNKSVCGFSDQSLKEYIETLYFKNE